MTPLKSPVVRRGNFPLDGSYGPDRGKRLVARLVPGTDTVPDVLELRPEGSRRPPERVALIDAYRYAIRARTN